MPSHSEKRILPFSVPQLYEVVAGVEDYPLFLPWVTSVSLSDWQKTDKDSSFVADVVMGYKMMTYPYRCRVHLAQDQGRIDIDYLEGPFSHLTNYWTFRPLNDHLTELAFHIDFELKSSSLRLILQPLLSQVVGQMTQAFEKRAHAVYS